MANINIKDVLNAPILIGDTKVHIVELSLSDSSETGVVMTTDDDYEDLLIALENKDSHHHTYGFVVDDSIKSLNQITSIIGLSDNDNAEIIEKIKADANQMFLSPVFTPEGFMIALETDLTALYDSEEYKEECRTASFNYTKRIYDIVDGHAHISKFIQGMMGNIFQRYNKKHTPDLDEIAEIIMNSSYIDTDGTINYLSIADVETIISDLKKKITVGKR